MRLDDLTIGEAKQLATQLQPLLSSNSTQASSNRQHPYVGKFVIARTRSSGVHFGTVAECSGTEVILKDARRLWSWSGAFTLSEVSQKGIGNGKISCPVPEIYLPETIELIPCSSEAAKNLDGQKVFQP